MVLEGKSKRVGDKEGLFVLWVELGWGYGLFNFNKLECFREVEVIGDGMLIELYIDLR